VDPALVATSGYDFRNNVNGDTYIFLLGDDLDSWHDSRREFVKLAGRSSPLIFLDDTAFNKKMKKNSIFALKVGNPQWVHSVWEPECDQSKRHKD
jgi:hypothetical protein